MGFLTTITLKNDHLHSFKADPLAFAKAIFDGMDRAYIDGCTVDAEGGYLTFTVATPCHVWTVAASIGWPASTPRRRPA